MTTYPDIRSLRPSVKIYMTMPGPQRGKVVDISKFVYNLHTSKQLSHAAGTFTIDLAPTPDLDSMVAWHNIESWFMQYLRPMNVVIIGMAVSSGSKAESEEDIMFGFIDGIYSAKTTMGEQAERRVTIRGRDATKLFIEDSVAPAPELSWDERVRKHFISNPRRLEFLDYIRGADGERNIFMDGGTLPEVIYWILKNIPGMYVELPPSIQIGKTPKELFLRQLSAYREDRIYDTQLNMYAGTVMNYMLQCIDSMFYELYVDTIPKSSPLNTTGYTRPILILRPKPYDHEFETDINGNPLNFDIGTALQSGTDQVTNIKIEPFEALTSPITGRLEEFTEHEVLNRAIGIADDEVFNIYKLSGSRDNLASSVAGRYGYYFPLLDLDSMRVYGMRLMQVETKILPFGSDIYHLLNGEEDVMPDIQKYYDKWRVTKGIVGPVEPLTLEQALEVASSNDREKMERAQYVVTLTTEKRNRLWRWNRYNDFLLSGQITVKGRNVFVGSRVYFPDEPSIGGGKYEGGNYYYVQAVQHRWTWGEPWVTTLSVTRGHNTQHLKDYHDYRGFGKKAGDDNNIYVPLVTPPIHRG